MLKVLVAVTFQQATASAGTNVRTQIVMESSFTSEGSFGNNRVELDLKVFSPRVL